MCLNALPSGCDQAYATFVRLGDGERGKAPGERKENSRGTIVNVSQFTQVRVDGV
jgi:hypothetical protein